MLTYRGAKAAVCLHHSFQRETYRTYMCGLCHTLNAQYGFACRLFTSHELTLLNLLGSALCQSPPNLGLRRCPLNPFLQVQSNQDPAAQLAAAVSVELARVKFADDVSDSGGKNLVARLAGQWAARLHTQAQRDLTRLGLDPDCFSQLMQAQQIAEQDRACDAALPSAQFSAELFAACAGLAGLAQPAAVRLSDLGAAYGEFVYLQDAWQDFPKDLSTGQYNPLRPYARADSRGVVLAWEGLDWLAARLRAVSERIRTALPAIPWMRHADLLKVLLLQPVSRSLGQLEAYSAGGQGAYFARARRFGPRLAAGTAALPLWIIPDAADEAKHSRQKPPSPGQDPGNASGSCCDSNCCDPTCFDCRCCDPSCLNGCNECGSSNCDPSCAQKDCCCSESNCDPNHCIQVDCCKNGDGAACNPPDCTGCDCSGCNCNGGGCDCAGCGDCGSCGDCGGCDCNCN